MSFILILGCGICGSLEVISARAAIRLCKHVPVRGVDGVSASNQMHTNVLGTTTSVLQCEAATG